MFINCCKGVVSPVNEVSFWFKNNYGTELARDKLVENAEDPSIDILMETAPSATSPLPTKSSTSPVQSTAVSSSVPTKLVMPFVQSRSCEERESTQRYSFEMTHKLKDVAQRSPGVNRSSNLRKSLVMDDAILNLVKLGNYEVCQVNETSKILVEGNNTCNVEYGAVSNADEDHLSSYSLDLSNTVEMSPMDSPSENLSASNFDLSQTNEECLSEKQVKSSKKSKFKKKFKNTFSIRPKSTKDAKDKKTSKKSVKISKHS